MRSLSDVDSSVDPTNKNVLEWSSSTELWTSVNIENNLDSTYIRQDGTSSPTGSHNYDGASFEIPNSTSLPGTCTVGQQYMDTDATSGQRFYLCESTDTWALQGGAGDVSASANITDHSIVRGDGGLKGVQESGIIIDDSDNMTLPTGADLKAETTINAPEVDQNITAVTNTLSSSATHVQLNPNADYVMTSTPTIAAGVEGQLLMFENISAFDIDLQDDSVLAGSDIFLGRAEGTIAGGGVAYLFYTDSNGGGWCVLSNPNTAALGADATLLEVRNATGTTLAAGKPVYISGYNVGQGRPTVALADADDSSKMPAIGIVAAAIADGANGDVITSGGAVNIIDTSGQAINAGVYIGTTAGELVYSRPTGATTAIQRIGTVARVNLNNGVVIITGAGRQNDEENITEAYIFVGNANEKPIGVAMSGDVAIIADGTTTVQGTHSGSAHHAIVTVADTATIDMTLTGQEVKGDVILAKDIVAGSGLSGGEDNVLPGADADTTLSLDINSLSLATIVSGDFVPFWDITATATNKKITFTNFEAALDHGGVGGLDGDDHTAYENELNNSAGLRAALDDETGGTGLAVFNTNPTLTGATLAGILADNDDMVFEIDANNDGTNKYSWTDGLSAEIMSLTEAGVLAINSTVSASNLSGTNTGDDDQPEAGDYAAASIDGDDINSNIAGTSLTLTAGSPDTLDVDDDFLKLGGDVATAGTYDFGSANVVLEIPNATAPTTDATGEMAIDTDLITQGMLQVYLASAIANVVATTDTPGDNEVPTYDSAGGTVQWEVGVGGANSLADTLAVGADANDVSITSLAKLEGFDAQVYIDLSTDGKIILEADVEVEITSPAEITGLLTLTGGQIKFPASQSASADVNTLDDYEEGIWTPALKFGSNSVSMIYDDRLGRYTKIGNRVFCFGRINLTNKGSSTGNATLTGLPFPSKNTANYFSSVVFGMQGNLASMSSLVQVQIGPNTAIGTLYQLVANTFSALTHSNFTDTSFLNIEFSYEIED